MQNSHSLAFPFDESKDKNQFNQRKRAFRASPRRKYCLSRNNNDNMLPVSKEGLEKAT